VAQTDTRTLQQIKQDTERARAGLTDTVDQLRSSVSDTATEIRQRISPDHIKAEVSDYFRSRGEQLIDTVTTAARRNPIQAVAVGASLAYPMLRLVRSIPVPILMVGAGLFLAGSKTGQDMTQKASDAAADFTDHAARRARDARAGFDEALAAARDYGADKVSDLADAASVARDYVSAARDHGADAASRLADGATARTEGAIDSAASAGSRLSSTADDFRRRAAAAGEAVRQAANDAQDKTVATASSITEAASDLAAQAGTAARDAYSKSVEGVRETMDSARQRSAELSSRAGKTLMDTVQEHPLAVAGIGLLIGGLIASALPRSDLEDQLVGDTSSGLKSSVRDAASQGAAAARDVANGVYDDVARRADAEGLTPDHLGEALSDLGERVRKVADAAVTTAFEPDQVPSQQIGDIRHG
jgi:ElaB/YqjD/DUF883 family membrane-anchored ribosome-binding protein